MRMIGLDLTDPTNQAIAATGGGWGNTSSEPTWWENLIGGLGMGVGVAGEGVGVWNQFQQGQVQNTPELQLAMLQAENERQRRAQQQQTILIAIGALLLAVLLYFGLKNRK